MDSAWPRTLLSFFGGTLQCCLVLMPPCRLHQPARDVIAGRADFVEIIGEVLLPSTRSQALMGAGCAVPTLQLMPATCRDFRTQ